MELLKVKIIFMCKVLYIMNKNKPDTEKGKIVNKQIADIVAAQESEFRDEGDGYSVYRNGKTYNYPGQDHYQRIEKNTRYNGESTYCVHFRTSTGGGKGADGLHLQKLFGRYVYAHNGTVSGFNQVKTKSDSHFFFSRLIQKWANKTGIIGVVDVNQAIEKYNFNGKGFLYDEKEKITYFFCNQAAHIYILDNAFIIATYEINRSLNSYIKHEMLGYTWYEKGIPKFVEGIIHDDKVDDIYMEWAEGIFSYSIKLDKKTYNNGYSYGYSKANEAAELEAEYSIYAEQFYNENGFVPTEKQLDDWIMKTFDAKPEDLEEMKAEAIEADQEAEVQTVNEQLRLDNLAKKGKEGKEGKDGKDFEKAGNILKRLQKGGRGNITVLPNGVVVRGKVEAD